MLGSAVSVSFTLESRCLQVNLAVLATHQNNEAAGPCLSCDALPYSFLASPCPGSTVSISAQQPHNPEYVFCLALGLTVGLRLNYGHRVLALPYMAGLSAWLRCDHMATPGL